MESLKTKSRIVTILTTLIVAVLTYIASMNPDQLATELGVYGSWASVIIVICASIINQISEEKRVKRAEDLIKNGEPTIRVEVDADKVLSEIEKRKSEALNAEESQVLEEPPIVYDSNDDAEDEDGVVRLVDDQQ